MFGFGPPNVEKLKAKGDVKGLVKALNYEKDFRVRLKAALALGEINDAPSVEALLTALKDSHRSVRRGVAQVLGKIGDVRAVEPLIAILEDSDSNVRKGVAWALGKIGWEPKDDLQRLSYAIANRQWSEVEKLGVDAVEPLLALLKDGDGELEKVAEVLGKIGDTRAVEPLIVILKDSDSNVRKALRIGDKDALDPNVAALNALALGDMALSVTSGNMGESRVITALRHWGVREAAATALGKIGDARAVEPLLALLKGSDSGGREVVAEALKRLGH